MSAARRCRSWKRSVAVKTPAAGDCPNKSANGGNGLWAQSRFLRNEAILSRRARVGYRQCVPAIASIRRRTCGRSDLNLHTESSAARTTGLTGCRCAANFAIDNANSRPAQFERPRFYKKHGTTDSSGN